MERKPRKQAWITAFIIALITAALLVLPYIIGHQTAPEGTVFTGLLVNLEDGTYLSAIEQGRSGAWLYRSHFTVEPHEPVFLEGYYLFLGQIGRLLNLSTITMWHLGQFGANVILFVTIFGFISIFLKSNRERFAAYLLALFGAGYDWWRFPAWFERQVAFEVVPIDLRFPEAHIFYSALTFPHFVAGITLILLVLGAVFYLLVNPVEPRKKWLLAVGAGVANLLLGIVYPFLILLPAAVLGCFYLYLWWERVRNGRQTGEDASWWRYLDWKEMGLLAVAFLIPLPLYLYYAVVFLGSPVLRTWNEQAFTPSPNPVHYLLTYGLYLLLGGLYLLKLRRKGEGVEGEYGRYQLAFLWVWVGAAAVLLYVPLNSQRRFVEGLQVPLSILAVVGFFGVVWPWILRGRAMKALLKRPRYTAAGMQRLLLLILIGLAGLANIYLYSSTLIELGLRQPYPLFRPETEFQAMTWLQENIEPGDVVLAGYRTGSYLPYGSGATVIVGNRYESGDFERKRQEAARFYQEETTDEWRQQLLAENNVRYVFVGREERRLGAENPFGEGFLRSAYDNGDVIIYIVSETDFSVE